MERFLLAALTPLARLCLRRGVKVQSFLEAAKRAFVEGAETELRELGSKPSVSRIAAMTGLQRKDIKRLHTDPESSPTVSHFLSRVLGRWVTDPDFCDPAGAPRQLSLAGNDDEFARLVTSVSTDLSPYTALFELERLGAVKRDNGTVRLITPSLEISRDDHAGLRLLSDDIKHLTACVSANLTRESAVPNLHARTQYDNIAPSAVADIKRWILERGAEFHRDVRAYLARFDRDLNPTLDTNPARVTVTVGAFSDIQTNHSPKDDIA